MSTDEQAAAGERHGSEQDRAARDASARLEVFIRTIAHELKNPIAAADGAAQLLADDAIATDPAQRHRFTEIVRRNLRRAVELVDDLRLVVASGEDGERGRTGTLAAIVTDVRHEVESAAEERGVELRVVEPVPEVPVDAARATLVLMNLVWNAVKYADPDKAERWVRIGARPVGGDTWHCYVADNGLGIATEDHTRVFERFVRVSPSGATPGTGLGLAIAREAVEQLGGRIWLESEVGLGTTFHVLLPVHAPADS